MTTAIAYIAHTDKPGSNVYLDGVTCRDCDDTFDPMRRYGVPCRNAYYHAKHAVQSWQFNGVTGARVAIVEVADTGDYAGMVDAARAQLAARAVEVPAQRGAERGEQLALAV